jgi:hypothetical protein
MAEKRAGEDVVQSTPKAFSFVLLTRSCPDLAPQDVDRIVDMEWVLDYRRLQYVVVYLVYLVPVGKSSYSLDFGCALASS